MIGIVGMPGSGKSEFVNIALTLGYRFISMGDIVRERNCKKRISVRRKWKSCSET